MMLLGLWVWSINNSQTKLIFCDVGQGDGILLVQKNLEILIDTGPDNKKILNCLDRHLPFWDKTIEVLIVTHSDGDHSGGLKDVLRSYKIVNIFSDEQLEALNEQNIYSKKLYATDMVNVGLINYEVVNPEKNKENVQGANEGSIAGILTYKDKKILLLADVPAEVEQKMVWRKMLNQKINVLKVSHHGSETATSDELLEETNPSVAIVSVGKNNRFGHPRKEVLEKLNKRGIKTLRTDESGEIVFNLD